MFHMPSMLLTALGPTEIVSVPTPSGLTVLRRGDRVDECEQSMTRPERESAIAPGGLPRVLRNVAASGTRKKP